MGYQEELTRLTEAKASMRQSIINKGVDVPEDAKIETYPDYIAQIEAGPSLTDWGVIYSAEYPEGIQLISESEYNLLNTSKNGSFTLKRGDTSYNFSRDTITGYEFGKLPTETPEYFLAQCTAIIKPIVLPSNITTINEYFLYFCSAKIPEIYLPDSIMAVKGQFTFRGLNNFTGPLTVNCSPTFVNRNDEYFSKNTLCVFDSSVPAYVQGISIRGTGANYWKNVLPDRTSSGLRKLILTNA